MAAAINNNNGSLLTNAYATPAIANASGADRPHIDGWVAYCAIPAVGTDLAGSTYRMGRIKSSAVIYQLRFAATALTAGAISIGLRYPLSGAPLYDGSEVSANLFATSIDCSSAVAIADKRYTNLALTTAGKRVWELLGLSSDPCVEYDLTLKSTTAATAAGTLLVDCLYSTGT